MGTNKALLQFSDGTTVIERIVQKVRPLCPEIVLVTNTPDEYAFLGLPMHGDDYPGASSLGGICTGLNHIPTERALVLSCDLPHLHGALLAALLALPFDYDLLIPYVGGRQQPLHAIYARTCLAPMRAQIAAGDLKIIRLLDTLRGRRVEEAEMRPYDPTLASFRNMNTPEDWAEARRLDAAHRAP